MDVNVNVNDVYNVKGDTEYSIVLEMVQKHMSTIGAVTGDMEIQEGEGAFLYKKQIESYITTNNIKCKNFQRISDLVERLYNSMVKYDILTPYLQEENFLSMGIEEIYGRWNCIYMKTKDGKVQLKDNFPSLKSAVDILNRIANKFNANINEGTPKALGELAPNVRASVVAMPVTSEKMGAEFNIRIVHGSKMTRELLLEGQTLDEKSLNFLEMCASHKVNICIGGATGSGKTGTMYYLLSYLTRDATYRVGTIEIECREFDLERYDENGVVSNDVFHWVTRSSDNERYNISANDLVATILRFTPDIVGIGEMRNKEALIACELGISGHGVITTIHASDAETVYERIVQLCKMAGSGYDDNTLYKMALKAFPIVLYQEKIDHKTRKVFEIAEGLHYDGQSVRVNPLFKFVISDTDKTSGTRLGNFQQVGRISEKLRQRLLSSGVPKETLKEY